MSEDRKMRRWTDSWGETLTPEGRERTADDVSVQDQIDWVRRELGTREFLYPKRVDADQAAAAKNELLLLRAILRTLHEVEDGSVSGMVV